MATKQVSKSHYFFHNYITKRRWTSIWHQLKEVISLQPINVLEVGPGSGIFKTIAQQSGIKVYTLDIDEDLEPDIVGSATEIPLPESSYDVVCAFQILEHLPYHDSLMAFSEMVRVSRRNVVLSLPDAKPVWRYLLYIPKIGNFDILISRPFSKPKIHNFDGQHYWEINKIGFAFDKVVNDLSKYAKMTKTYRIQENPYHRFLIFEKINEKVKLRETN